MEWSSTARHWSARLLISLVSVAARAELGVEDDIFEAVYRKDEMGASRWWQIRLEKR